MEAVVVEKLSDEKRFSELGKRLRKAGVHVRRNVVECCRGCVSFGSEEKNAVNFWSYAGQGSDRLQFDAHGNAVAVGVDNGWRYEEPASSWLFYHSGFNNADGSVSEAGQAFLDASAELGFAVDWEDHSSHRAITLSFEEVN